MSRRTPARAPITNTSYSSSPLLSISTITYIASWRGQLLICTIVLFLGAIYFVVRRPIQDHLRRRKEEIARARQRELMRSEAEAEAKKEKPKDTMAEPAVVGEKSEKQRERGREKKKELKKRKGSLLRVPIGSGLGSGTGTDSTPSNSGSPSIAGPSSLESSPVPKSAELRKRSTSNRSPSPATSTLPSTPERQPGIRLRHVDPVSPSDKDVDETPKSSTRISGPPITLTETHQGSHSRIVLPEQVPLPPSPSPGPSRLRVPTSEGYSSDTASSACLSEYQSQSPSKPSTRIKSDGFSIIPEDGWLPPSVTEASSSKKKKKKNRPLGVTDTSTRSPLTDTASAISQLVADGTSASAHQSSPVPPRRHSRQDSLTLVRPIDATPKEYEAHIDRMDGIIDRLRGELGASLASSRMAKEAEEEAKQGHERAKAEVVKYKQKLQTVDGQKRREADLSHQLHLERQHSTVLLRRVAELERMMNGKSNGNGVPPSPYLAGPNGPPSPFLNGHFPLNGNINGNSNGHLSPMPPGSPFGIPFPSSSPALGPRGSVHQPMPNGMYPSPMLHPHSQFGHGLPSPIPYPLRRTSTSDTSHLPQDVFAGPLTLGTPSTAGPPISPFPAELGHGFPMPINMPIGTPTHPAPNSPGSQERRTSIEASVLRKKIPELGAEIPIAEEEEGSGLDEQVVQGEEGVVEGLGMGAMTMRLGHMGEGEGEWRSSLSPPETDIEGAGTRSSNPPTPSPQSRLLTPSQLHPEPLPPGEDGRVSEASGSVSGSGNGGAKVLWGAELTPGQLKQRMHLAAMRQQRREEEEARAVREAEGTEQRA